MQLKQTSNQIQICFSPFDKLSCSVDCLGLLQDIAVTVLKNKEARQLAKIQNLIQAFQVYGGKKKKVDGHIHTGRDGTGLRQGECQVASGDIPVDGYLHLCPSAIFNAALPLHLSHHLCLLSYVSL